MALNKAISMIGLFNEFEWLQLSRWSQAHTTWRPPNPRTNGNLHTHEKFTMFTICASDDSWYLAKVLLTVSFVTGIRIGSRIIAVKSGIEWWFLINILSYWLIMCANNDCQLKKLRTKQSENTQLITVFDTQWFIKLNEKIRKGINIIPTIEVLLMKQKIHNKKSKKTVFLPARSDDTNISWHWIGKEWRVLYGFG